MAHTTRICILEDPLCTVVVDPSPTLTCLCQGHGVASGVPYPSIRSTIVAIPCPTPMHIVARP